MSLYKAKYADLLPLSFEAISQTFFLIFPAFAFNQLYESVYKEYHPIHGQIIH